MTEINPRRRRRDVSARGDESRAEIVDAAKALFARNGYRGTALQAVADRAGLSQAGLLYHFKSKQTLLLALLADRDREDGRLSATHLVRRGTGLLHALGDLVEHNQTEPETVRLFSVLLGEALAPDHPAHSYFVERYRRIRDRIVRNLNIAESNGEIAPGHDHTAMAAVVVAVLDGLQYQWLLDDDIDMLNCYRVLCEALLDYLSSPLGKAGEATPVDVTGPSKPLGPGIPEELDT